MLEEEQLQILGPLEVTVPCAILGCFLLFVLKGSRSLGHSPFSYLLEASNKAMARMHSTFSADPSWQAEHRQLGDAPLNL